MHLEWKAVTMPSPSFFRHVVPIILLTIPAGCGQWLGGGTSQIVLEGERLDVLGGGSNLAPDRRVSKLDVILPRPEINEDLPQAGGIHVMQCIILQPQGRWQKYGKSI